MKQQTDSKNKNKKWITTILQFGMSNHNYSLPSSQGQCQNQAPKYVSPKYVPFTKQTAYRLAQYVKNIPHTLCQPYCGSVASHSALAQPFSHFVVVVQGNSEAAHHVHGTKMVTYFPKSTFLNILCKTPEMRRLHHPWILSPLHLKKILPTFSSSALHKYTQK